MPPVSIENPILNSPFEEPARHLRFDDDGITDEIVEGRRQSAYFIPVAKPKKKGGAAQPPGDRVDGERMNENDFINQVREHVDRLARPPGYPGVTPSRASSSTYWTDARPRAAALLLPDRGARDGHLPDRVRRQASQPWIENALREDGQAPQPRPVPASPSRWRPAPARPSSWRCSSPGRRSTSSPTRQDARFSDAFLIVTPGHHHPRPPAGPAAERPDNYYQERDLLAARPAAAAAGRQDRHHELPRLPAARHARGRIADEEGARRPRRRPDRVHRDAGPDGPPRLPRARHEEEHRRAQRRGAPLLPGARAGRWRRRRSSRAEERAEAKRDEEAARVWLNGLRAVKQKLGIRAIYDLSATPFFLAGLRLPGGDAVSVGRERLLRSSTRSRRASSKIPRVPVADDAVDGDSPDLPRPLAPDPRRPAEEGPGDRRNRRRAEAPEGARGRAAQPLRQLREGSSSVAGRPVPAPRRCSSSSARTRTSASSSTTGSPAGTSTLPDGATVPVPGALRSSATSRSAAGSTRPNTLLIDSAQLESGDAMDPAFKKIAAAEIDEFKASTGPAFPGRVRGRHHRRGPAARGHEHDRQARTASASRSAASCRSRCSPRAGTPTPSPTSSASVPSGPSCCASRSSAGACAG